MNNEFIAIPEFQERVSPLLDEARRFVLLEVSEGRVVQRTTVSLNAESAALRIAKLREIGVTVIISGAVSGYLARLISENSLRHYSWVSGPVDEVIEAYLAGKLKLSPECTKPCRGTGRSCGRGIVTSKKNISTQEKIL